MAISKKKTAVYAGLSITCKTIELAVFSPKTFAIESSAIIPTPPGMLDRDGDQVLNPELLRDAIAQLLQGVHPKPKLVNLSIPGSLLRMVEIPRLEPEQLYVSLSSEAERYKTFDNTDAVVDFAPVAGSSGAIAPNMQRVVFGAARSDALATYLRVLQSCKLKVASISLEPVNILRGMAGTGVLDSLVQQIGMDAQWGTVFVEPQRVRISIWQGNNLLELRETHMDTTEFETASEHSLMVEDLVEEIRRSTKSYLPAIWLTHGMPQAMAQILSARIGTPLRPCPLGEIGLSQPDLKLATVGSTLSSTVEFPFNFDLLHGAPKAGGLNGGASEISGEESPLAGLLMKSGTAAIVLGVLATGVLLGVNEFWNKPEVAKLETAKQAVTTEVGSLEARKRILESETAIAQALIEMINKARVRNHVYVALTRDLQSKAPDNLWIHSLQVNDQFEIQGIAISHQSVIDFARSFDGLPYANAVLLNSLKESLLGATRVFDFKIGGAVNLDSTLSKGAEASHPAGEP